MKKIYIILCIIMLGLIILNSCLNTSSNTSSIEETGCTQSYVFPEPDDSDGTLYFTCKNWNMDLYKGGYINIAILSINPLDLNEVEILIKSKNEYAIELTGQNTENLYMTDYLLNKDRELSEGKLLSNETLPYFVYQCYRGTDWKKMRELYDIAKEAQKQIDAWRGSRNDAEFLSLKESVARYEEYRDLYLTDYESLTSKQLDRFYVYTLDIALAYSATEYDEYGFATELVRSENIVSEVLHTIYIKIGNETYTQDIGEVRIHSEYYPEYMWSGAEENINNINTINIPGGPIIEAWGDGMIQLQEYEFETINDITFNKLYLYESDITPIGARFIVSDKDAKNSIDFYWDLKTSFTIEKGKNVKMYVVVEDERSMQLEYGARCCPTIEYEVNGEQFVIVMEQQNLDKEIFYSKGGAWIRYASVFDGLSEQLKSYYDDYYRPIYETWREDWD